VRAAAHVLFAACVAVALALALANVLAWRGQLPWLDEGAREQAAPVPASAVQGAGAASQAQAQALLTVTARSGPCYLVVRDGGEAGELRFRGLLERGQTVEVSGARLWVRAGATQNVVFELDGEPVTDVPANAAELIVTPAGVAPAAPG
jgi:hypothetical protein